MIEDQYSVNIYFLVVFDINLDLTLCSLLAAGSSAVPAVFLVENLTCGVRTKVLDDIVQGTSPRNFALV